MSASADVSAYRKKVVSFLRTAPRAVFHRVLAAQNYLAQRSVTGARRRSRTSATYLSRAAAAIRAAEKWFASRLASRVRRRSSDFRFCFSKRRRSPKSARRAGRRARCGQRAGWTGRPGGFHYDPHGVAAHRRSGRL